MPQFYGVWRGAKALGITMFQYCDFPIKEPYISQLAYWALICEEADAQAGHLVRESQNPSTPRSE